MAQIYHEKQQKQAPKTIIQKRGPIRAYATKKLHKKDQNSTIDTSTLVHISRSPSFTLFHRHTILHFFDFPRTHTLFFSARFNIILFPRFFSPGFSPRSFMLRLDCLRLPLHSRSPSYSGLSRATASFFCYSA